MALSACIRQMIWLKRGLSELRFNLPCAILCDSTGAQSIAENPIISDALKHIEVHHHYVREQRTLGNFELMRVDTADNLEDIGTKSLGREIHHRLSSILRC